MKVSTIIHDIPDAYPKINRFGGTGHLIGRPSRIVPHLIMVYVSHRQCLVVSSILLISLPNFYNADSNVQR